jgi:PelA/Pel-15E family pectate lyase
MMWTFRVVAAMAWMGAVCTGVFAEPPSVALFYDGVRHYQAGQDRYAYARHAVEDVRGIAENILLHQRSNGGWPANWDPLRILTEEEAAKVAAQRHWTDTTLDNRATYPQIEYLAGAFTLTGDRRYREAALRGLRFLHEAQHPSGGFPHSFPNTADYRGHVTFMDDVTVGALRTLRKAGAGAPPFVWLGWRERRRARAAVARGTACILRLQVLQSGRRSVWAGQYDAITLQPAAARPFEPVGLVSAESVRVVQYLMELERPSREVIAAVEEAVAWFRASQIRGMRLERFAIAPVRFTHHTATHDVRLVRDAEAPPLWARFYELDSNRPFMANRDGRKVYDLSAVELERRTGYSWYGHYARQLIEESYPAWRARLAGKQSGVQHVLRSCRITAARACEK